MSKCSMFVIDMQKIINQHDTRENFFIMHNITVGNEY